jgi:hypothetical protein
VNRVSTAKERGEKCQPWLAAWVAECFGAVERLNAAGRIAAEWGAFGGWAHELGLVLAQGHGAFEQQRDSLVARLRGLKNLPARLLDKLDELDPPGGGGTSSMWSSAEDWGDDDGGGGVAGGSVEVDGDTGSLLTPTSAAAAAATATKRSAFEARLLAAPSWSSAEAAAPGGGKATPAAAAAARRALSPTQTVEVLDEAVSAAVVGAGPLRLDREQLGFCRAQLEALQATAHVMAAAAGLRPLRDKLAAVGECRRVADGALAALGPQLRAAGRRRRRAAGGLGAALAAAAQGGGTCAAVFVEARRRVARRFRYWNARALVLGALGKEGGEEEG